MKHPHADVLTSWIQDASRVLQYRTKPEAPWLDCPAISTTEPLWEMRLKPKVIAPKMIKVGNRTIRAPESEPLEYGQDYFTFNIATFDQFTSWIWVGDSVDYENLKTDFIFTTKENAIAASKAIAAIMKGTE